MNIELINSYAAKWTVTGWFVGLAYYNWFASAPAHLPIWAHAILVVGGLFVAPILIGGGVALLMAGVTKILTGRIEGSPDGYAWGAFISPVLAFFAAGYVLQWTSQISN
jgi:hypothetical protein